LRRAPLVAVTIVATVGLGLGLVAAVFTILNAVVFQPDDVQRPHEPVEIVRQPSAGAEPRPFTRADYEALLRETDAFSDAFALGGETDAFIEGQRMQGSFVTGNFFQALGVSAARGRTLTPADEAGRERAIVLSHHAWSRYIGSDPGVLSRAVEVNDSAFQVVGVAPEGFRGLAIAPPDFWAPLSVLGDIRRDGGGEPPVGIVGRLNDGVSSDQALAQLVAWDVRRALDASG